jgi:hypothetical protein
LFGVIAIVLSTGGVTVIVKPPLIVPELTVKFAVPCPTAVSSPEEFTVATDGFNADHVTLLVISRLVPSL